ncbi:MAG: hypothetical protein ACO1SV_04565 [Fimbriimonas sp.]
MLRASQQRRLRFGYTNACDTMKAMALLASLAFVLAAPSANRLSLVVCTPVSSDLSRVGDYVLFRVAEDVRANGVYIPAGCPAVGKVKRQSKKVAFSLGRVLLKGDTPFASPHAVVSISADYVTLPDGRTVSVEIDPAPRSDDHNERMKLRNEYWPQRTMEPEIPARPLTEEEQAQWEMLFKAATNRKVAFGRLAGSRDSNDLLHNSLASMRDILALRQTVEFADGGGTTRLRAAAEALRHHSVDSLRRDSTTTQALALTFAATVEVANLYGRTHRGIRGWERKKQIAILPGVVLNARVIEMD